ncbi:hypothetical protein COEREDRAFT_85612 [Coemansia reversa NRRL 1564]|uniref:NTF2 domain-containing protein n=1 Tax=Coemansia reversa (strain ATCC 12441 / NRRL 1564) TaxID=763665 RepID=A0A2G5BHE9_COERN|nr:hypothetical protein COEREDRAFT_85612 [Coemansia reversa NRRL 1564]|eukprot:PIA18157.1 hypothetical protein COEREDRAFT_85612 [Coemansia reversa NRRL 1564]
MSSSQQPTLNGAAAAASGTEATKTSVQEIGWMFAREYYTIMHDDPKKLQYFYGKKSTFVHGTEGEVVKQANGQQEIYAGIAVEDYKDRRVEVTNVDMLPSIQGSIIIQVIGKMADNNQPFQRFAQTFFLAEQRGGYYLHNDILRYLKDDDEESEPVSEVAPNTIVESKPVVEVTVAAQAEVTKPAEPVAQKKDEKVDTTKEPAVVEEAKPVAPAPVEKPAAVEPATKPVAPAPVAAAESKSKAPKEKPAAPAAVSTEAPKAEEPQSGAVRQTTWANLAADGSGKWGNTIAKVEGTVAPAANPASSATPNTQSRAGTPATGPRDFRRKNEALSVFLKNIPQGTTIPQLKSAFKKIGPVYVDYSPSKTTGVAEFNNEADKQAALDAREVSVGDAKVIVEERRFRQSSGRRDGSGPNAKQPPSGQAGASGRNGSGEFERVSSGRGSRSRTGTNASGGRPRGGKQ